RPSADVRRAFLLRDPKTDDAQRVKRKPQLTSGARTDGTSRGRTLDAPILSQGTNQARRGSRKRPDPPLSNDGPGLATDLPGGPVMANTILSKNAGWSEVAIAPGQLYLARHVVAYLAGGIHRPVPPHQNR